jgi:hypothetical protein
MAEASEANGRALGTWCGGIGQATEFLKETRLLCSVCYDGQICYDYAVAVMHAGAA